jgi:beta-glucosidase/6-phospho-beta-glucosidase/beta-galactosidase
VFRSFFLAGFEGATGYNRHGQWMDQVAATQHDQFVRDDYRLIREAGLLAAREVIRWPLVDRGGRYDFSPVVPFVEAARENDVEVIWDLFHYGYPDDLDLFSDEFPRRFADYCYACANFIAPRTDGICYFTPVNEPSFFAWAAGDAALFAPHQTGRSFELKAQLARAAIQGIDAIRTVCPHARIVNADPWCHVVPPRGKRDLGQRAERFNQGAVYQSWDMLAGRLLPELGGSRSHLDVIGINYYWTNQWELDRPEAALSDTDPRRWGLSDVVRAVWERYGGDLLITETAHRDEMRPAWIREVAAEIEIALDEGIPVRGVCLYPVLGMPEWHAPEEWTRMGLWDLIPQSPTLGRVPCDPALEALGEARRLDARLKREADLLPEVGLGR